MMSYPGDTLIRLNFAGRNSRRVLLRLDSVVFHLCGNVNGSSTLNNLGQNYLGSGLAQENQIDPSHRYFCKSIAMHLPFLSQYFCKGMPSSWQKVVDTPPICITISLPFVLRCFCRRIRVRGRSNTPNKLISASAGRMIAIGNSHESCSFCRHWCEYSSTDIGCESTCLAVKHSSRIHNGFWHESIYRDFALFFCSPFLSLLSSVFFLVFFPFSSFLPNFFLVFFPFSSFLSDSFRFFCFFQILSDFFCRFPNFLVLFRFSDAFHFILLLFLCFLPFFRFIPGDKRGHRWRDPFCETPNLDQ